jgi:molecular chaperone HscB
MSILDPFATLGLSRRYDIDLAQLESRYRELQRALHPDRHVGSSPAARRISLTKAVEVNEAYRALKDDLARGEALLALERGAPNGGERSAETPEFLMEMMELREQLGEARAARDRALVQRLATDVAQHHDQTRTALSKAFDAVSDAERDARLSQAARLLGRLKYYRRFLDEVNVIEEESLG